MARDEVQKNVHLPRDLVEWFDETYPMYGSWKWFFVTSLRRFKELHEVTPDELVELGIKELHKEE